MEIRRIFYSVQRNWWLIILLMGLGGGISFLYVYLARPMYQADTVLYIMNRDKAITKGQSLNTSDITVSEQLVRQYYEIIYSRTVTLGVSQKVKEYNLSEEEILSMVSINSKLDSNVFTISAKGYDPTIVAAVANATGSVFSAQIRLLSNSDNVGILDEALVPQHPVPNHGLAKILMGIFAGVVLALGIVYVIEYFDTTVRSAEDIEKGLKVRVIGIIPENNI